MAVLAYCMFAGESVRDVVAAVEMWPNFRKVQKGDEVNMIMLSCFLRFAQGLLASCVVLLLVVSTSDVIEIILNFTAVNFISGFDNVAFELAQCGKYGPLMEAEAKRIENLPAPPCIARKYRHVRYRWTIIPVLAFLLCVLGRVTYCQLSRKIWMTTTLRVQFADNTNLKMFNGCYAINKNLKGSRTRNGDRKFYNSYEANPAPAKFGYCANDNRWFLYTGDRLDACNLAEENKLAYSGKTYTFDIASSFGESWASRTGAPLGLYFFKEVELNDESCNAFLGDGICNTNFNTLGYGFDSGDCCAATCNGPECGFGAMEKAFDTVIGGGDGYPDCKGPDMVPITIYLNNVYLNDVLYREDTYDNFATQIVRDALMTLDCDGSNVLLVPINEAMTNKTETVMVTDGASCSMMIKNVTSHYDDVWFVDYTIYHGDKNSIEIDPIVIKTGSSFEKEVTKFQRIPNCFFTKLSDFINKTTIYTGADPSNQAIDWLLEDSSGFSKCERRNFIERYALAVINFAAPIYKDDVVDGNGLWISTGRQCAWKNVICVSGNVTTLSVGADSGISLKGTMAPEIALLKNLTELDMSQNDLRGTISPEIGECKNLRTINIEKNNFTGTIPSEIAQLTGLKWFFCGTNSITGTIPTIFAEISSLLVLTMRKYPVMLAIGITNETKIFFANCFHHFVF